MCKIWYRLASEGCEPIVVSLEQIHWIAMKQTFHYFKNKMDFSLCFLKNIGNVAIG
jgi:hypothetical protein